MAGPLTADALMAIDEVEFTAFCDIQEELFPLYREKYGVRHCYKEYRELLERDDIDVVCIATPPFHHQEAVLHASKKGKHIILEKPIARTLTEADVMIRACEEAGVQLGVIFMYRFMDAAVTIKEALEQGVLGRILSATCSGKSYRDDTYYAQANWRGTWWGEGGGSLISQTIHFLDLLLYFLGDVDSVWGQYRTAVHQEIEVDDLALASLTFKSGALANVVSSTAIKPGYPRRLEIHGEKGSIILEEEEIVEWKVEGMEEDRYVQKVDGDSGDTATKAGYVNSEYHRRQILDFLTALKGGGSPLVDGWEGRRVLEVIRGIYQSGDKGTTIQFPVQDDQTYGKRIEI